MEGLAQVSRGKFSPLINPFTEEELQGIVWQTHA